MATASEASQQANRSGMDPKRLVLIFYMVAGMVVAAFLARVLAQVWGQLGLPDPEVIEGLEFKVTSVLGIVLAAGTGVGCYWNARVRQLSLEVASELMKVTWPSWAETRVSTTAVVIASLVAAVVLFGIDSMAYKLMVDWLPTLWGKL